jgi:hypothetical protein
MLIRTVFYGDLKGQGSYIVCKRIFCREIDLDLDLSVQHIFKI